MEGKSSEVGSAEEPPVPSVAKLAGIFGEQRNSPRKEIPPPKPTRRKPPCSLPLNKLEVAHNDERVSPPACLQHKIKVKSSPLIEKLQANLAFPPVVLLPGGGSPKSPGPKVMTSPFSSPPLTPGSPGIQSRSSESDEAPVSFENPPEGAHTLSNAKDRTKGSIKRRPPSRKFRKSQTECGTEDEVEASKAPKENGEGTQNTDDVFDPKEIQNKEESESLTETQVETGESPEKSEAEKSADEKETEREIELDVNQGDIKKDCDEETTVNESDPKEPTIVPTDSTNTETTKEKPRDQLGEEAEVKESKSNGEDELDKDN
ncbi:capZ-interacting protein [Xenopus laevis]|uniref:CapZ-interacting protein n=1 Tax=Xenopus laevis TaxID=8355 RepID=A0A8J1M6N3_XENLA|nr:capZ-interacting protein [Xenopus laevis]